MSMQRVAYRNDEYEHDARWRDKSIRQSFCTQTSARSSTMWPNRLIFRGGAFRDLHNFLYLLFYLRKYLFIITYLYCILYIVYLILYLYQVVFGILVRFSTVFLATNVDILIISQLQTQQINKFNLLLINCIIYL